MKKSDSPYEPHLVVRETSVSPGGEWIPKWPGWSVIQIREGTCYHLQPPANRELQTGAVLVTAEGTQGTLRASQLGVVSLCSFNIIPARLTGLISLGEQQFFSNALSAREPRVFPAGHRIAIKMVEVSNRQSKGLACRLKMLEVFAELFGNEPDQATSADSPADARKRLQDFLETTPSSELLEMSFSELAQKTHCTERHLSRIFHEFAGVSFREKRAELRLMRARDLLATTNAKVVDVALESGYKSLSLFNLMFARRFGVSPGRWRKQHAEQLAEKKPLKKIDFGTPARPRAVFR
jgi:AraC-like DNA-binding protein